jgi:dTDP-4-dehydrorhamnose 3,5-epimerase-like enzyme
MSPLTRGLILRVGNEHVIILVVAELTVPVSFPHGFCTLEHDAAVFYKVLDFYTPPVKSV